MKNVPQKAYDNLLHPNGKRKKKKEVQETTWLHTSGDFQTPCVRVMKYLQCSLQQSKQGERCEVFVSAWMMSDWGHSLISIRPRWIPKHFIYAQCLLWRLHYYSTERGDYGLWSNWFRRDSRDKLNWGHNMIGQILCLWSLSRFIMASASYYSCSCLTGTTSCWE